MPISICIYIFSSVADFGSGCCSSNFLQLCIFVVCAVLSASMSFKNSFVYDASEMVVVVVVGRGVLKGFLKI